MVTEVPFRPRKMDSQEPHGGFADWVVRIDVVPLCAGCLNWQLLETVLNSSQRSSSKRNVRTRKSWLW